jgi:hypothetical protein
MLALYVRISASRGTLEVYRLSGAAISRIHERSLDLERPEDLERFDTLFQSGRRLPVEYCKLLDYRRDAANCWKPGLGHR